MNASPSERERQVDILKFQIEEIDKAATMRWPIEQCFEECKSYLGMGHYETRSWIAWHRHMLFIFIAHLFTIELRLMFKKNSYFDNAAGYAPSATMNQSMTMKVTTQGQEIKVLTAGPVSFTMKPDDGSPDKNPEIEKKDGKDEEKAKKTGTDGK